jgi:hypothetical protein
MKRRCDDGHTLCKCVRTAGNFVPDVPHSAIVGPKRPRARKSKKHSPTTY